MRKFQGSKRFALGCIIPLILCAAFAPSHADFPDAVNGEPLPSLAPILERVAPAVVNISTRGRVQKRNPLMDDPFYRRFFGYENAAKAMKSLGSGVVVDAREGLIVTNHHVIENIQQLLVTLSDGREFQAKVLGSDPKADIAVLQIAANGLTEMAWSDSSELRIGDFAMAIGNPYGQGQAIASGIVSAVGPSGSILEGVIQTDASINAANSGGALINLRGQLIGLNTAIVGPGGTYSGIGFALPSKMVRDVAIKLLRERAAAGATSNANMGVGGGTLGITAQALTPELARVFGVASGFGVVIGRVESGSSAESAGLRSGDVITGIDGNKVRDLQGLQGRIDRAGVGQQVKLDIIRNQQVQNVMVTVGAAARVGNPLENNVTMSDQQARNGRRYVQIDAIRPGSAVEKAGVEAGDIILTVNREKVVSAAQVEELANSAEAELKLFIQRGRSTFYVDF